MFWKRITTTILDDIKCSPFVSSINRYILFGHSSVNQQMNSSSSELCKSLISLITPPHAGKKTKQNKAAPTPNSLLWTHVCRLPEGREAAFLGLLLLSAAFWRALCITDLWLGFVIWPVKPCAGEGHCSLCVCGQTSAPAENRCTMSGVVRSSGLGCAGNLDLLRPSTVTRASVFMTL